MFARQVRYHLSHSASQRHFSCSLPLNSHLQKENFNSHLTGEKTGFKEFSNTSPLNSKESKSVVFTSVMWPVELEGISRGQQAQFLPPFLPSFFPPSFPHSLPSFLFPPFLSFPSFLPPSLLFSFKDSILRNSLGSSQTGDLPASASWLLELQVWAPCQAYFLYFCQKHHWGLIGIVSSL
jgi:hypothetical protein